MLDAFNHFLPPAVFERFAALAPENFALRAFRRLPALWDIEARLRVMDAYPGYQQVICLSNPPIELLGPPEATPTLAAFANDELAETCRRHPDRFPAFVASLPMNNPDAAVREAERAITTLGARGVQLFTNVAGRPLSDPIYQPVFDALAAHDLPVLLHPMRGPNFADYPTETASQDEIWFTFGWPYETSACVARLIHAGLFDRLPGLELVTHHCGGMIPFFARKIGLGFSQIFDGSTGHNPQRDRAGLAREPAAYYPMLFADTATNGSAGALACGHEYFGTGHLLFATDAPFDPNGGHDLIAGTLAAIAALPVPPADRQAILDGNARRLFRLPAAA